MKRLGIIGSGDLGQLIAHHAASCGYETAGFFDDFKTPGDLTPRGKVLGPIDAVSGRFADGDFEELMVAVGYRHLDFRWSCYERFRGAVPFATLVHPSCSVDASAEIGDGAFLLPGCVLDAGTRVGENALLNTGCVVAHDSSVGANCFLGPGVTLAGLITIGRSCFIGVGTTIIDRITIADGVQTGGGSVVIADLTEPGLYVGVPARLKRRA